MSQPNGRTLASIRGTIMLSVGTIGALAFLAGCGFVPPPEFARRLIDFADVWHTVCQLAALDRGR